MLTILVFLVKMSNSPSPKLYFKRIVAPDSDAFDEFVMSCSLSDEVILVGTQRSYNEVASYVFNLNGTEINKLIPADFNKDSLAFAKKSFSIYEKIVLGAHLYDNFQVFSRDGQYERTIKSEDDYSRHLGYPVATFGDIAVTNAWQNSTSSRKLHVVTAGSKMVLQLILVMNLLIYMT